MIFQKWNRSAFTLIEVLSVIGIIAILISLLLPSISMVRTAGLKTQAKARFYEYIFALESYFHEYGRYPYFFYEKGEIPLKEFGAEFVKALSGHGGYPDYEVLLGSEKEKLNPKGIVFHHFDREEFNEQGWIVDSFGNPDIYISLDVKNEGLLNIKGEKVASKIGIYSRKTTEGRYGDIESWK